MNHPLRQAAFFVGGMATGGLAAYVLWTKQKPLSPPPPPPPPPQKPLTLAAPPRPSTPPPFLPAKSSSPSSAAAIFSFGSPGPISDIIVRDAYALAYDRHHKNPAWVAEHLTATPKPLASLKDAPLPQADRSKSVFKEDPAIPYHFRAHLKDYLNSGFDRGHMAPSADAAHLSQKALDETFYLSNIAPQVGVGFNREYWAYFERFVRTLPKSFHHVYVMTGPLYLPKLDPESGKHFVKYEVIGDPPNVAVPTHFYKVIVAIGYKGKPSDPKQTDKKELMSTSSDNHAYVASFVLPNDAIKESTPLSTFLTPLEAIEHASGIEFFKTLLKDHPENVTHAKVKQLCLKTECQVLIKKFDQANNTLAK